jgi:RNA polymerase sigma-70 factor (ECF subfamily)
MQRLPFETTHWSLIMAAGGEDSSAARAAIARLCEKYWYPLYAYARRQGLDPDDARDLTQGFLASLLERHDIENVRQERGRFRSFLLASLKHFITNEATRRLTQKRGGEEVILSLELGSAEGRYSFEPADPVTPESLYERRWALTVIERVLAHLRQEWEVSGRGAEFDELKACLLGETPDGGYLAVAEKLNTTEGAVRTAIHRLRRKFQARLRHDIAETVSDPADIEDELQYLIRALKGSMA